MNWVVITSIVLGVVTFSCAAVKLHLSQKVRDIDGLSGVHRGESNIIASIGDESSHNKTI